MPRILSPRVRKAARIGLWVGLGLLVLCLVSIPAWRRGSGINHPRPVTDAGYAPEGLESLAVALNLREYPPLQLDARQENALKACIKLSRLVNQSVNGVAKFDAPEVKDELLTWQTKMSRPFYAEFLLAKWHERHGNAAEARRWMEQALEHAPVVLVRKYRLMDGKPLAHTDVGKLGVECRMRTATSANGYQTLEYIDLVTDEKGQVYLPCYDTRIRCNDVQYPEGYEIETGRHGYLKLHARYSLLPTIHVWRKGGPRPATDLPPSEFYDYKKARQVKGLKHRIGGAGFRIERCFRLGKDGALLATDGLDAIAVSENEPLPSFRDRHASLDQAVVRFKRNTLSGHEILQVRLFDHRTRALLTEYHVPAAWSYQGRDDIALKSFGRPLPEHVDVWFWVTRFDPQDKKQTVPPQVGATAEFKDYKAALTHVHSGSRSYSTRNGAATFRPPTQEDESTVQAAFQITSKQTRSDDEYARVVAVGKDGSRMLEDHVIYPSNNVFVCDFPMKLSDLDHFELHPVGQELYFFFDGVRLPPIADRILAESWQVVIPTGGQTGPFAALQTHPAHVEITVLPGRNSMSFRSRGLSSALHSQTHWTYGREDRDPNTHSTIVCETHGLAPRMLKTEIIPLDVNNEPVGNSRRSGQSGSVTFCVFDAPAHNIHAVRIKLSCSGD